MFSNDSEDDPRAGFAPEVLAGGETQGEVIQMIDFNPIRPGQIMLELRNYWESLRKGRAIPERADVEPRGIRNALDYAFILERVAPGAARFRLAGKHLIDLMGMEVRGMPFCSLLEPSSRGRLSDVLESVFKAPQIADLRLEAESGYGRPPLSARMLILPLRSDLGDVTRALGCIISEGEIGRAPRRFDIQSDAVTPVIPGALALEPSPSATGFGEAAPPWRTAPLLSQPSPTRTEETPEERRARFRIVIDKD